MNAIKAANQIPVTVLFGSDIYTTLGEAMVGRADLAISQMPITMMGLAGTWVVSDRQSGKIISLDKRRSLAIRDAILKLEQHQFYHEFKSAFGFGLESCHG